MKQETLKELEKNYDKILIDLKDTNKIFSWAKKDHQQKKVFQNGLM